MDIRSKLPDVWTEMRSILDFEPRDAFGIIRVLADIVESPREVGVRIR